MTSGFVRLTDAAVLIAALEMGFAAEEGIALDLRREASWSSIRDKVGLGAYPVAHMLSPMPIWMSAGLAPMPGKVCAPFVLGRNGNTLTATPEVAAELFERGAILGDAASLGAAFRAVVLGRRLKCGVPFPHSMHLLQLQRFLREARVPQDRISLTIAPPPVLPDVLRAGEVDVFMVGEPWGTLAVERGDAVILLAGADMGETAPEKVLGVREDWAEAQPDTLRALLRGLYRAARWVADPDARGTLAEILSSPRYLDIAAELLEPALRGTLFADGNGRTISHPRLIALGRDDVSRPRRAEALWIAGEAAAGWGLTVEQSRGLAAECFRPDLYAQALAELGAADDSKG